MCDTPAHPEPVPSGVRTVVLKAELVARLYANSPREVATACEPATTGRKPVEISPRCCARRVTACTAAARRSASSPAVESNQG